MKRVKLQPLDYTNASVDVPELLSESNLSNAHCYDPNKEGKIRGIIHDCGQADFEENIRGLGSAMEESQP